ncbi:MAG: molecular chaperone SurA [Gammaproteobacteria bacterium]|jgi:peptidyl-prolyl cis-trans isomerase SurA|nr:molecular chaperone SurA [Gammaproteobacteria bacterium]MBQ09731.1 molecular chaperone SurA [Gammaproteobacteria bacterium]
MAFLHTMNHNLSSEMIRKLKIVVLILILQPNQGVTQTREIGGTGELVDGIAAIVNDGVVLRSEVEDQITMILSNIERQDTQMPPIGQLRQDVLERLILQRIQLQRAERYGIAISDEGLNAAINNVALNNNVTFEEFPEVLAAEGIDYFKYRTELKQQITLDELRQREVSSRISVSQSELDSYLILQKEEDQKAYDYDLSHILLPITSRSGEGEIDRKQKMINDLRSKIASGESFESVARNFSEGQQSSNGGRLGWMKGSDLPEIFLLAIRSGKIGELSQPFQSSSGFHLLKINGVKGNDPVIEEQINVRHILIKTNEILDDAAAEEKLKTIRTQIIDEGDFGAVASAVSEDPGSAQDGGDMGWAPKGLFVPEFEEIAYSLGMNQISAPFKSRYGWHIIQYLGQRSHDITEEVQRRKAVSAIRSLKLSDEVEIWARELRDEAYVEKLPFD